MKTEEISSPIAAHILDFYDGGLGMTSLLRRLPPPVHSLPLMMIYGDDAPAAGATAYSPLPSFDTTLTALLEEEQHHGLDTELLPQIDGLSEVAYYPTATDEAGIGQFNQMGLPETLAEQVPPMQMSSSASVLMPPTSDYDECYTAALAAGGFMGLDGAMYQQTGAILPGCNAEASQQGFFNSASSNSTVMIGEYQKMMEDSMQGIFNTNAEMQVGGNNQHLINGCNGNPTTLPPTELSGLEDSTFKVVRLSPEERKEKIHWYIKKRNERNFSKKIKYACRKTLADSRPRVRGMFAKNDELCEAAQSGSQSHEHYEQTDHMKEEDMRDTSDILAQLSGLNSYNYKYKCTIESWI
uniref:CCT domain-containing protein n=1 Tax=Setaria italica TaxID=4555 RepID=K3Z2Y9_SETIT